MARVVSRLAGVVGSAASLSTAASLSLGAPPLEAGFDLVHAACYFRHGARAPIYGPTLEGVADCDWNTFGESALRSAGIEAETDEVLRLRRAGSDSDAPRPSAVDGSQRKNVLPGGCRSGELTAIGYEQAERLGGRLKERYGDLLSDGVASLSARTTHVSRCVLSLRGVLAAFKFPVPVFVDTVHISEEWLTPQQRQCARLAELWAIRKSPASSHALFLEDLARRLPDTLREAYSLPSRAVPLKDVLIARRSLGVPLPWGLDDDNLQNLDLAAAAEVAALIGGSDLSQREDVELLQLAAGRLIHELKINIIAATTLDGKTLRLVSGHDTTVKPLLIALGLYDHRWPPFCACVAVEVYQQKKSNKGFFVRVLYNGKSAEHVASDAGDFYVAQPLMPLGDFIRRLDVVALDETSFQNACSCCDDSLETTVVAAETRKEDTGDTF